MKDKWNVHGLHSMLVQERKIRLKNQGSHSVHYVSHQGNQGAWKEIYEEACKGKGSLKNNDDSLQIQRKVSKGNNC